MPDLTDDTRFMTLALNACRAGIDKGQSPFGACIVRDGIALATTHNHVRLEYDATAHAEVCAIRAACGSINDVHLTGATIYSTTEPCPMCFTAIHWAQIERIVFGARVEDAKQFGFNELQISNETMKSVGIAGVEITPDFMRDEAIELFRLWQQRGGEPY